MLRLGSIGSISRFYVFSAGAFDSHVAIQTLGVIYAKKRRIFFFVLQVQFGVKLFDNPCFKLAKVMYKFWLVIITSLFLIFCFCFLGFIYFSSYFIRDWGCQIYCYGRINLPINNYSSDSFLVLDKSCLS